MLLHYAGHTNTDLLSLFRHRSVCMFSLSRAYVLMCLYLVMFRSSPVSSRGDEVYAAVDSGVWNPFLSVNVDLLLQVRLILVINELHDGQPARPC